MYKKLIVISAVAGIGLFFINQLAMTFYWYTSIPHFDKVVHILGGVFVALAGSACFFKHTKTLKRYEFVVTMLLFVFIIGLFWEYYEYIVQFYIKAAHLADIPDSIGDLSADMFGGVLGVCFVIMMQKRYNRR